jgi:hypothetical protein
MDAEEKQFYVLLTIFGSMFGIGPFIFLEATGTWTFLAGCALTILGLAGLLMLVLDRRRIKQRIAGAADALVVKASLKLIPVVGVWILVATLAYSLHVLRSDLDVYVMPRVLTKQQIAELHKLLTEHDHAPVVLKYDHYDKETEAYAGQWADVLAQAGWPVTSDTDESHQPFARDANSICVEEMGARPGTQDPPAERLVQALETVATEGCSGHSETTPGYKLFLVVGHRPLALHKTPPILTRIGQWLERKATE